MLDALPIPIRINMPTQTADLKQDIARIARKEAKALIAPLLKRLSVYKHDIAALKRDRTVVRRSGKAARRTGRTAAQAKVSTQEASEWFSADALIELRARLELSAQEFGLLVDASAMSIYRWEAGKGRPRDQFIIKLAAVRNIGKMKARKLVLAAQES